MSKGSRPPGTYTRVDNVIIDDKLSDKAFRLVVWLLSMPSGWQIHHAPIMARFKWKRSTTFAVLRELADTGYLKQREKVRGPAGTFAGGATYSLRCRGEEPELKLTGGSAEVVHLDTRRFRTESNLMDLEAPSPKPPSPNYRVQPVGRIQSTDSYKEDSLARDTRARATPPPFKQMIPEGWRPSAELEQWAFLRIGDGLADELQRFVDHSQAFGVEYVNPEAAFRSWITNPSSPKQRASRKPGRGAADVSSRPKGSSNGNGVTGKRTIIDAGWDRLAELDRRIAERELGARGAAGGHEDVRCLPKNGG